MPGNAPEDAEGFETAGRHLGWSLLLSRSFPGGSRCVSRVHRWPQVRILAGPPTFSIPIAHFELWLVGVVSVECQRGAVLEPDCDAARVAIARGLLGGSSGTVYGAPLCRNRREASSRLKGRAPRRPKTAI